MQLVSQTVHSLSGYAFLHDFAVTPQHYVVFQNPVRLSLAPFILGQQGPAQCVDWAEGQPMQVGTSLLRCTPARLWGCAHDLLTVMFHPKSRKPSCTAAPHQSDTEHALLRGGSARGGFPSMHEGTQAVHRLQAAGLRVASAPSCRCTSSPGLAPLQM